MKPLLYFLIIECYTLSLNVSTPLPHKWRLHWTQFTWHVDWCGLHQPWIKLALDESQMSFPVQSNTNPMKPSHSSNKAIHSTQDHWMGSWVRKKEMTAGWESCSRGVGGQEMKERKHCPGCAALGLSFSVRREILQGWDPCVVSTPSAHRVDRSSQE